MLIYKNIPKNCNNISKSTTLLLFCFLPTLSGLLDHGVGNNVATCLVSRKHSVNLRTIQLALNNIFALLIRCLSFQCWLKKLDFFLDGNIIYTQSKIDFRIFIESIFLLNFYKIQKLSYLYRACLEPDIDNMFHFSY